VWPVIYLQTEVWTEVAFSGCSCTGGGRESGWLVVYSCCSHLDHRASMKLAVSRHFQILRHSVGLLGRVISPSQGHYLTQRINTDIHASSGIRAHDPSVRANEDSSYLRPRGPIAQAVSRWLPTAAARVRTRV
jgi:hypothetical protein